MSKTMCGKSLRRKPSDGAGRWAGDDLLARKESRRREVQDAVQPCLWELLLHGRDELTRVVGRRQSSLELGEVCVVEDEHLRSVRKVGLVLVSGHDDTGSWAPDEAKRLLPGLPGLRIGRAERKVHLIERDVSDDRGGQRRNPDDIVSRPRAHIALQAGDDVHGLTI